MTARPSRHAALGLLLLAGCAAPQDRLEVDVEITGAITRRGTYAHAADDRHGCRELRVYGMPGEGGPPHGTIWEIRFAPAAMPPEPGFLLTFDYGMREREMLVRMTAGGRLWHAVGTLPDFRADIRPAEDFRSGRFTLHGLRPFEGGPERIAVSGRWRCPAEAPTP